MVNATTLPIHPIRAWREARGLSQRGLADRLIDQGGRRLISYVSLGRIERGQQPASQGVLIRLWEISGGVVTPNDVLGWERRCRRRDGAEFEATAGEDPSCVSS